MDSSIFLDNFIFLIILIILEFIEISLQKGSSLKEILNYNYSIYKYNIFIFFVFNFTFFYVLFVAIFLNKFNLWINIIIILKFIDISFKIYLFNRVDRENSSVIDSFFPSDIKLSKSLKYSNVTIYSSLMLLALLN